LAGLARPRVDPAVRGADDLAGLDRDPLGRLPGGHRLHQTAAGLGRADHEVRIHHAAYRGDRLGIVGYGGADPHVIGHARTLAARRTDRHAIAGAPRLPPAVWG